MVRGTAGKRGRVSWLIGSAAAVAGAAAVLVPIGATAAAAPIGAAASSAPRRTTSGLDPRLDTSTHGSGQQLRALRAGPATACANAPGPPGAAERSPCLTSGCGRGWRCGVRPLGPIRGWWRRRCELLFDGHAREEPGCVVAGCQELRACEHEVAFARAIGGCAQAVAEFEFGLEEICL